MARVNESVIARLRPLYAAGLASIADAAMDELTSSRSVSEEGDRAEDDVVGMPSDGVLDRFAERGRQLSVVQRAVDDALARELDLLLSIDEMLRRIRSHDQGLLPTERFLVEEIVLVDEAGRQTAVTGKARIDAVNGLLEAWREEGADHGGRRS